MKRKRIKSGTTPRRTPATPSGRTEKYCRAAPHLSSVSIAKPVSIQPIGALTRHKPPEHNEEQGEDDYTAYRMQQNIVEPPRPLTLVFR
jgi:hypothetical protein